MHKKLIVATLGAVISFGAFADMPPAPQDGEHGPRGHGDMMSNLTDEQKSCIKQYGCTMPDMPAKGERPEPREKAQRGEKPEMSAEHKEAMTCMQNAMKACGVEMPTPPEKPHDKKPESQE